MEQQHSQESLLSQIEELRFQLDEAHDTINAIRTGQVDALIVKDDGEHQLYTLKTADQTYRVFIERMSEGAVTINKEGIILYCNTRFANMAATPLELTIGQSLVSFVPDESKGKLESIIKGSWNSECREEIILKDGGGKDMHCLFSCNTIELDNGTALSIIITDLTLLKNTESALHARNAELFEAHAATEKLNDSLEATVRQRTHDLVISREHFKLLTNNIDQMTWTNLPTGEFISYNQRWFDYTGHTLDDEHEIGWEMLVHPDDLAPTLEKYNHSLATGELFEIENRYKRHDGAYRWHLNRAKPLKNDAGDIIFWVGTATNIEEQRKEMERKDEFIGIASHELKTPLTSLKGYLQLIAGYKKEELPPVVKQYITKALGSINKLQSLINDLLDVSKIKAGRLQYAVTNVAIDDMVTLCIENSRHINPGYTFNVSLQPGFIVQGNQERLEQVLMNLLNNAVKYSPYNKSIDVAAVQQGDKVRIAVTDNGIGLSADQKSKIFERFYRVEDRDNMTSGLGMGLYISQEIINNHNGAIGVESELGVGSTFYFVLPLVKSESF